MHLKEKSINYKAKESMRVTERKIIHFMECEIKTLPGVKNVIRKEISQKACMHEKYSRHEYDICSLSLSILLLFEYFSLLSSTT